MEDGNSEVTITNPDNEELNEQETKDFLIKLQEGVVSIPQGG